MNKIIQIQLIYVLDRLKLKIKEINNTTLTDLKNKIKIYLLKKKIN